MKKGILITLIILINTSIAFSKVDFVRVMFNHNGDTRATIGWKQMSGDSATVIWGTEDHAKEDYKKYRNTAKISTRNTYKEMDNCFVRLFNLKPNTAYYFIIKDSEGISERYWFKTTPNQNTDRLSLIAGGDSRSRRTTRQDAFKMVGKLKPHAVIFDGDYTDFDTPIKWKEWFEDYMLIYQGFDNQIIPFITTRGNHETSNKCLTYLFDCPAKNNVYNVTLGGDLINIICLNTEIAFGGSQRRFLENTLIDHTSFSWQIPVYHRACRPHVNWKMKMKGVKQIYNKWVDLFEKHGVRLAIECDSHITKTTWPIRKTKEKGNEDGFVRDDKKGIVYSGEGCWGAPLRVPDRIRSWTRDYGSVNSFKWIFIDKDTIELRTVAYTNVKDVAALTEKNRFEMPEGIELWSPENGDVVFVKK